MRLASLGAAQEILSSLFSFLNGVPHFLYLVFWRNSYAPKGYYMSNLLKVYSCVCMNSWLWSTIFHARDVKISEAGDYYFATSQIFFSVFLAIIRLAGRKKRTRSVVGFVVGLSLTVFYARYVWFMENVLFDYGYHMKINLGGGVLHLLVWVCWVFVGDGKARAYRWKCLRFLGLLLLAALCEVFDFPPFFGLLDAHATWHGLTIPLVPMWYQFWASDAEYEVAYSSSLKEKKD